MSCPSCGADRADLAAPCPHCGAPGASSTSPLPPPAWPDAQPQSSDGPPPPPSGGQGTWPAPPGAPPSDPPPPGGPPAPPRPPSRDGGGGGRGLVIGLVVVVVLALGAIVAFLLAVPFGSGVETASDMSSDVTAGAPSDAEGVGPDTPPPGDDALPATGPDTPPPGLDGELDDLWLACAGEDWAACDDLYFRSDFDSDYERFGDTCGYRTLDAIFCETEFGDAETSPPSPDASPDAAPPGQDAALDDLWSACRDEDWVACDRLYFESAPGSDYEFFGATCGNRDLDTGGADLCQNLQAAAGALPVVLPDDLAPGLCFDEPTAAEVVYWIPTVACDQPHDVEVMGLVDVSDSTFPADMSALAFEQCEPIFADFVGLAYPESVLDIYHLSPTQESWSLGDRGIACGVYDPAGPVEGSLQGAAR